MLSLSLSAPLKEKHLRGSDSVLSLLLLLLLLLLHPHLKVFCVCAGADRLLAVEHSLLRADWLRVPERTGPLPPAEEEDFYAHNDDSHF